MNDKNIEEKEIINAPEKIYLQIGCKDYDCTIDFNELSDVTWSKDQIDSDDIEYVKSDTLTQYKEALSLAFDLIVGSTEYEVGIIRYNEGLLKISELLKDE